MVFVLVELFFAVASVVWCAPVSTVVNVAHVASVCALPISLAAMATTTQKKKKKQIEEAKRGKTFAAYTPEDMKAAAEEYIAGYKKGSQSKKKGARRLCKTLGTIRQEWLRDKKKNIPYNSLKRAVERALQDKKINVRNGRPPWFSEEDEAKLIKHCDDMADVALCPDKNYVMWLAGNLSRVNLKSFQNKKGEKVGEPTSGWWRRFKSRHPAYGLKSTQSYERNRATAADAWAINKFFDTYEECLNMEVTPGGPPRNTYQNRADRVGNLDESGFQGTVRPTKSFSKKGTDAKRLTSSDNRETETLVSTSIANGHRPAPIFLFLGQGTKWNLLEYAPAGTGHEFMGESAYQTQASWPHILQHLKEQITGKVAPDNRFLLLVDGHISRITAGNLRLAKDMGFDILVFPGHLTHFLQPEDRVFGGLKKRIRTLASTYVLRLGGSKVNKTNLVKIICDAWKEVLTVQCTKNGWENTGLNTHAGAPNEITTDRNKILKKLPAKVLEAYEKWKENGGPTDEEIARARAGDDENDGSGDEQDAPHEFDDEHEFPQDSMGSNDVPAVTDDMTPDDLARIREETLKIREETIAAVEALSTLKRDLTEQLMEVPMKPAARGFKMLESRKQPLHVQAGGKLVTSEEFLHIADKKGNMHVLKLLFQIWKAMTRRDRSARKKHFNAWRVRVKKVVRARANQAKKLATDEEKKKKQQIKEAKAAEKAALEAEKANERRRQERRKRQEGASYAAKELEAKKPRRTSKQGAPAR